MDNFGDSLAGVLIVVIIMILLFYGDPDIADSLRLACEKWALSL